jgi:hypothetical protein
MTALAAAAVLCSADSAPQPPVVVELFTSQGCSSCPPADRWLGTLRERYGDRVIALSMHVGYWDYIGWKDPFARREFNERQRLLATANGNRTVYTPGVFVQGREAADWMRAAPVEAALRSTQQQKAAARATLAVLATTPTGLTVRVQGEAPAGARLWLALLQDGLSTSVKAGENRGATLRNDHVVRDWRGPFAADSVTQTLSFPADNGVRVGAAWAVVALIDDARGGTLQAVRLPLSQCAGAPPRR